MYKIDKENLIWIYIIEIGYGWKLKKYYLDEMVMGLFFELKC